jgi:hypothetical protein
MHSFHASTLSGSGDIFDRHPRQCTEMDGLISNNHVSGEPIEASFEVVLARHRSGFHFLAYPLGISPVRASS